REPDPPPGHAERLRERVELDGDVAAARDLEEARRALAEVELGIRGVVTENHAVALGEAHRVGEERRRGDGGRRVVRGVTAEKLRGGRDVGWDRGQVGEESVL